MPGALDFKVEILPNTSTFSVNRAWGGWVDVTDYVEGDEGVSISYGRSDGLSTVEPGRLSLTLDNRDGRFTPGSAEYGTGLSPCGIRVSGKYGTTWVPRFLGDVDEWAITFPGGTPASSVATVTATSPMARMGRALEMRSVINEAVQTPVPTSGNPAFPVAYYPLTEPVEATTAADLSSYAQPAMTVVQRGAGGTLTFGTATGPGTDSAPAPTWTRASAGNGKYLSATLTTPIVCTGYDNAYTIETWFNTSTAAVQTLAEIVATGGRRLGLYITAAGKLAATVSDPGTGSTFTATGTTTVSDGATRHGRVEATFMDSALGWISVFVNNTLEATFNFTSILNGIEFNKLTVGGNPAGSPAGDVFNGVIAHVAVWASAGIISTGLFADWRYQAGATGFAGETAAARVSRLSAGAGQDQNTAVPDAAATTLCAAVDTTGASYLDMLQLTAATEGGILYDDRDGYLRLQARSVRYNPTLAVTLDAASQAVEASLAPTLNDQDLLNDVTVTWSGGTARATVDPWPPVRGAYRGSIDTVLTTLTEAYAFAQSRVNRFSSPKARIPAVEVDVVNTATAQILPLLQADISSVLRLTNLPAHVHATPTLDLFIEGYSETITGTSWVMSIFGTDASGMTAWVLDDPVYSVLDSTTILAY